MRFLLRDLRSYFAMQNECGAIGWRQNRAVICDQFYVAAGADFFAASALNR
jgi:hypothetical protein